jgi:hypothetical protein
MMCDVLANRPSKKKKFWLSFGATKAIFIIGHRTDIDSVIILK